MRGICYSEQMACNVNSTLEVNNKIKSPIPDPMSSDRVLINEIRFKSDSLLLQREVRITQQEFLMQHWLKRSSPYFGTKDAELERERVQARVAAIIQRHKAKPHL